MSTLPAHSQSPMGSTFGSILGVARDYAKSAAEILAAKSLSDINDGEFDLVIDPRDTSGITRQKITGSAQPVSIWRSYDMLFIGLGAVIIVGALAFRK